MQKEQLNKNVVESINNILLIYNEVIWSIILQR